MGIAKRPARILIRDVWPTVDCARHPIKRTVGETVEVWADVLRDGHEQLRVAVRYRRAGARRWHESPMEPVANDRFAGSFDVTEPGRWQYTVCAWVDRFASWRDELRRKVEAGQKDLASELEEGSALLGRALEGVESALATTDEDRSEETSLPKPLEVDVDPVLARFSSWYELFPRSWGGFRGVTRALPRISELGFDVLYFPPIHPIGETNRKGPNNVEDAKPGDPGSPWAIGGKKGGHTAIDPSLGTMRDFERLVEKARDVGLEIALDFAIQCSPDHAWLEDHPQWFRRRPDGTIKYAENPPKRYQDIVGVDFDTDDWEALWQALLDVVLFWVEHGVRVYRVDNPHTKPLPFWEWLIREVRRVDPEVVFLSEAFTRPKLMAELAKVGFNQSYTYFTWRNTARELREYLTELTHSELPQYFRPNFFANTPDILHAYLQHGGRPAFEARLVLAATLSPAYGIYSGFEHCENVPVREGSEEYLHSEKYEVKERTLDGPLLPLVQRINTIRRENPALQWLDVEFLDAEPDTLLAYVKRRGPNAVLVCVNLDTAATREGVCTVPVALGLPPAFRVRDLLADETFTWHVGRNFVRLRPGQAHVLRVEA